MTIDQLTKEQKEDLLNHLSDFRREEGMFDPSTGLGRLSVRCGKEIRLVSGTLEEMLQQEIDFVESVLGKNTLLQSAGLICKRSLIWIDLAKQLLQEEIDQKTLQLKKLKEL